MMLMRFSSKIYITNSCKIIQFGAIHIVDVNEVSSEIAFTRRLIAALRARKSRVLSAFVSQIMLACFTPFGVLSTLITQGINDIL